MPGAPGRVMNVTDQIFSGRAERFRERIYGRPKGQLRLELLWRDMREQLPLTGAPLKVWDAGGGLGQISQRLVEAGHRVTLSEPAADMLALAREVLPVAVECRQETLQEHIASGAAGDGYDLVVCHAVLEWLAQPRACLEQLLGVLRPGAYLSLLFYNVDSLALVNMAKGNLHKVSREDFSGERGSFTPSSPLPAADVVDWLGATGVEIQSRRSLRFVYDLMPTAVRGERSLDDIMAVEWQYGAREPFWRLGRYVHLICRKPA